MASGTNYAQEYGKAEKYYLQGNFQGAAEIIDRMVQEFPDDPQLLLLKGHVYCYGFRDYESARELYQTVLQLTDEQDLIDFANNGIEKSIQLEERNKKLEQEQQDSTEDIAFYQENIEMEFDEDLALGDIKTENFTLDNNRFSDPDSQVEEGELADDFTNPFSEEEAELEAADIYANHSYDNPFESEADLNYSETSHEDKGENLVVAGIDTNPHQSLAEEEEIESSEPNFVDEVTSMVEEENLAYINPEQDYMAQDEMQTILGTPSEESSLPTPENSESDSAIFEELSEVSNEGEVNQSEEHISEDFAENLFNIANIEQDLPDTILFNAEESDISQQLEPNLEVEALTFEDKDLQNDVSVAFTGDLSTNLEDSFAAAPQVEIKQGIFAPLHNAPLKRKPWLIAAITGLVSAVSVGVVGFALTNLQPDAAERKFSPLAQTGLISLAAGIASFGTTAVIGSIAAKRMKLASMDLQAQFEAVYQGNLRTQAKIYSQDEFGQMANAFNRMARVIATTTTEAQRRAEETEQAKEDLQRQVIRLLDDVEGAARGDLTVQATVTADVLGAVADAFNLTIQSLQEIVRQVKQAAEQVNKGSKDSELFARNQSSDALRMAEELAVTLNSVQMMTESIQRVAENAREAEKVARDSSASAIKGGEAVERTVSGILQIRETVSETARKVKRLAEASQEISKIVVLISQIAERTNQLALNASIQAAKAGDAGRGFAVVADEVRQLADRSGKALKEIEQIVLQIQSETGSVMTAMEEGIQEVIDVTERAEQAKRSLEDIIEVSQHIDNLVGSITADTVKQKENSFAVTQVMQSVEMTAQETSQESQRVAGSLQNLVTISQELLSSVEKFRLE